MALYNEYFPDGHLEDWDSSILFPNDNSSVLFPDRDDTSSILFSGQENSILSLNDEKIRHKFGSVAVVLTTTTNFTVNKKNNYNIKFGTGISEGSGCAISNDGGAIIFSEAGSYKFELCGDAIPFTSTNVKLQFYSDKFSSDIFPFCEINVPRCNGKLICTGLTTILPIKKGQVIIPRLIPDPDDSIVVMSNTKLLIYRVA